MTGSGETVLIDREAEVRPCERGLRFLLVVGAGNGSSPSPQLEEGRDAMNVEDKTPTECGANLQVSPSSLIPHQPLEDSTRRNHFRFEVSSNFKNVEQYQHLEIDVYSFLLPSIPDILAIVAHDSGRIYALSTRLSKSFVVDMAAMEELHINDTTPLLEALVPGHLMDAGTSAEKALSADLPKATKLAAIPPARAT
ncbi:hypothetical protein EYR40_007538 [Pleurotus pulmonarius]|nr:hypothetical protein EYR40_007538 [Pleurotus pulmonarius]